MLSLSLYNISKLSKTKLYSYNICKVSLQIYICVYCTAVYKNVNNISVFQWMAVHMSVFCQQVPETDMGPSGLTQ